MKFFLSIFTLLIFIMTPINSEQKIVFIDMDKLVSISKPGSSIFKQLKNINDKNLNFLKDEEKKFKEKEKTLLAQKKIISENEFKAKVDELKSEINNYNQNRSNMIKDFNNNVDELKSEINNYNQNKKKFLKILIN